MYKVSQYSTKDRKELFQLTAGKLKMTEAMIEKDFWVCLVLGVIFEESYLCEHLIFKGGTSLSKVYGLIDRFSEDIDLVLNWNILGVTDEEAWAKRSITQQGKFNESIDQSAKEYISRSIQPELSNIIDKLSRQDIVVSVDVVDRYVINLQYPAAFSNEYLLPQVKLEIGPRASRVPFEEATITSYAAQAYPELFIKPNAKVRAIQSKRTFWEKVTILHEIAHKDGVKLLRKSRHYYDVYKMLKADGAKEALNDLNLLKDVGTFKDRFYHSAPARYDLAIPGSLKLVPSLSKLKELQEDYKKMEDMIFGEIPPFREIIDSLEKLQHEINSK